MASSAYEYDNFIVSFPADYVAHVEINRPEKLNSFKESMWLDLERIFDKLSNDANVRCIVLSGAGDRAFTTGLDVESASQSELLNDAEGKDVGRRAFFGRSHILEFQRCISSIERCQKPVIAVLHGYSVGLAIDISCCADIRICSQDTKFSVKEVDIGLAADIGTLTRLPKCGVPITWVKEVCYTARTFGADEARRVGFVSQVESTKSEALAKSLRMADTIAMKSPIAVQGTKRLIDYSRDHSIAEGLEYTAVWNAAMTQSTDFKQAILSGLKKERPVFAKL